MAKGRRYGRRARGSYGATQGVSDVNEAPPRRSRPGPPRGLLPPEAQPMIGTTPPSVAAGSRDIGFLIVGTPRSGTTLVQRLATELPGVRVPPETHFFPHFGSDLIKRTSFPLDAGGIEREVE